MNLLQIHNAHKQYGTKVLFQGAGLSINEGEHIGVIGPNGAGKTTLFKVIVGDESLDDGEIIKSNKLRIAYLEQESEWTLDEIAEVYLQDKCIVPIWDLKKLGEDIGLNEEHFQSPLRELSGGYRMRMKLLYLIGQEPNLMLLDEPTNFLDLESILALERFLQKFDGAFLLISHDREFLKKACKETMEVENGEITKFPGNIDDYFEQKAQIHEILLAQAANQETKRKQMQEFVDKFRAKASKAKQAQSKLKQIEKMEKIEIKPLSVKAKILIPKPTASGKETFRIDNATMGYPDKTVLTEVNIRSERGDKIGVVGYNGAGKSTLLKTLALRLDSIEGEVVYGHNVESSYFAQHTSEDLDLSHNVYQALEDGCHPDVTRQDILNIAGSLLFSGDDIYKKIKVLSGGEKSRVALGKILLHKKPFLILDEPTNHLDFDTVEALTQALCEFEGTVIAVSHDRAFIRRLSSKILEIKDGRAEIYPGTYDEYLWSLQKGALSQRDSQRESQKEQRKAQVSENKVEKEKPKFNFKQRTKELNTDIKEFERIISKVEKEIETKTQEQEAKTQELLSSQGNEAQELSKSLNLLSSQIHNLEEDLLTYMGTLETKKKELEAIKAN